MWDHCDGSDSQQRVRLQIHRHIWCSWNPMPVPWQDQMSVLAWIVGSTLFVPWKGTDLMASRALVVCQLKRLMPGRRFIRRSWACAELRPACVARLIWPDGKWSVVVKLYRRVCTMSMHIFIFTFINMYVSCTYIYINSWTCCSTVVLCKYKCINGCTCTYHAHTRSWIHELV